jgi:hypothetical protein
MRTLSAAAALAVLAWTAPAQTVSGSFSPNPVLPGQTVTFTGTDAAGSGLNLPSPCGWYKIHQGSPTGPEIVLGIFCPQVIVPVPANGTFSFTWDQMDQNGRQVPPGLYWIVTRVWDPNFTQLSMDEFCLSIQPATATSLVQNAPVRVGQSAGFTVSSPSEPGAAYGVAWSLTANDVLALPGLQFCLEPPIFTAGLTNALGALDNNGQSNGLAITLPNIPQIAYLGMHFEGIVVGSQFRKTNAVAVTIQP